MPRRLSSQFRTAFVTGASSGLGRAFTEMLLAEGVRTWGTSRDPARLAGLGPQGFTPVALDLAAPAAAVAAWRAAALQAGGAFDLVVNNAGYGVFGEFGATDWPVWQAQLEAMLGTTLQLVHAAYGAMRAQAPRLPGECLLARRRIPAALHERLQRGQGGALGPERKFAL